ncbi:Uncharacterised protein [Nocardia otitidiscaviarum]|uniref:Uncharacterized protein n=1 Tax=Nocardia otitidiscaviarum TaxID=1823 RepID=A0A378YXK6_9NOCA|nr:hypothetical protein [Nocardia otitidiscaviarum]SUA81250.1 Uncharacterised protein [Nocardia otitidiscaviarum]
MTVTDRPARQGQPWTAEDYALLFDALARGLDDDDIADLCERTVTGVRTRARWLLDNAYAERSALGALGRMAAAPDFEWEDFVWETHQRHRLPLWGAAADEVLTTGWSAARPPSMAELTEQLGVGERDIARRCIRLRLAEHCGEVVDRFGAASGGELEVVARLARSAVPIGVLTVTDGGGAVVHQSLHPSLRAALAALPGLNLAEVVEPAAWTAALRAVGEGHTRALRTGVWGEWPEDLAASADLHDSAQSARRG